MFDGYVVTNAELLKASHTSWMLLLLYLKNGEAWSFRH